MNLNNLSLIRETSTLLETHSYPDYDCVTGNVATFLSLQGTNPDAVLGSVLVLDAQDTHTSSPNFRNVGRHQLNKASSRNLLRFYEEEFDATSARPANAPYVAIGDGFDMPWTPYFHQQHLEHGFLVLNGQHAIDPYRTITEFGEATPVTLDGDQWQTVPLQRCLVLESPNEFVDSGHVLPTTIHDKTSIDHFLTCLEQQKLSVEQLSTDTWLMARARRVNHRYAQVTGITAEEQLQESVDAWSKASEAVYIALRRHRRGRSVPTSYIQAITSAINLDLQFLDRWSQ